MFALRSTRVDVCGRTVCVLSGKENAKTSVPLPSMPAPLPTHVLAFERPPWQAPSSLTGEDDVKYGASKAMDQRVENLLNVHNPLDVNNEANKHVLCGWFESSAAYCRSRRYQLLRSKKITGGEILYVRDERGGYVVVKQQLVQSPGVDWEVTPTPGFCELRCMFQLNYLMSHKGVGPWFVPLLHHAVHVDGGAKNATVLSTEMPLYSVPLHAWLCDVKCVKKPAYVTSADPSSQWIYTPGGGRALATSTFESDRVLFNAILRAVLFQVRTVSG
jgi:hypothetical protein